MTDEELKLQHQEELTELARTIGAEIDTINNNGMKWGSGNTCQRFMMTTPMVMDVLKHVLQNPSLRDKLREAFDKEWYESANTRRLLYPTEKPTEKETQEGLMQSIVSCLAVCRKQIRLSSFFSTEPDELALANAVDDMGKLLWQLRYAKMKDMRLDWDKQHLFDQSMYDVGCFVAVRPCGKEYEGKTYLGILLGEFPMGVSYSQSKEDPNVIEVKLSHGNPAMYVPSLKKTILGCESWWHKIKKPEDLKDITEDDINSTWYVQALKAMSEKQEE